MDLSAPQFIVPIVAKTGTEVDDRMVLILCFLFLLCLVFEEKLVNVSSIDAYDTFNQIFNLNPLSASVAII